MPQMKIQTGRTGTLFFHSVLLTIHKKSPAKAGAKDHSDSPYKKGGGHGKF